MFERFTERARQVVVLAQEEARTLKHNYIGTEHILLGLLREEEGLAARVLESLDVTVVRVHAEILKVVGSGEQVESGQIPFTPRAKKVLELALREALSLGHNDIGTEHILLGLVRENEGVATRILVDLGAGSEKIRNEVIRMLAGSGEHHRARATVVTHELARRRGVDAMWLGELACVLNRLDAEIRGKLGRDPDVGDLLLVLACAQGTVAAGALEQLGIDLDALWGTIERVRAQTTRAEAQAREQLDEQIDAARIAKEEAIEAQQFDRAADLRDQERRLTEQQVRARQGIAPEVLAEIRRRLGIPDIDPSPPEPG
ncbi:MAG TPA: Clp protease N-terminal domain-containing protein [Solirubrobacteraceae bacterium]|nr:Clp protease N-terminal domain-containing protein [Solirubrobacteraceae bacterium]